MISSRVSTPSSVPVAAVDRCNPAPAALRKAAGAVASVVLSTGVATAPAFAGSVTFSNITDGSTAGTPVHLEFAVDGMEVRPAKEGLQEGTGHFHLLIDAPESYDVGQAIPFDETHLHFGKAQVEADVPLSSGSHTLTLQFANAVHESYGEEFRKTITVTAQ